MIDACNKFSSLSYPVTPTLFLEFHGSERSLEEQVKTTGKTLQKNPLQLASKGLDALGQNFSLSCASYQQPRLLMDFSKVGRKAYKK